MESNNISRTISQGNPRSPSSAFGGQVMSRRAGAASTDGALGASPANTTSGAMAGTWLGRTPRPRSGIKPAQPEPTRQNAEIVRRSGLELEGLRAAARE